MADFPIQVTTRGPVTRRAEEYAVEKIRRLGRFADREVLMARVTLTEETNPAVERHAVAKASLDVSGRVLRAHVAAEAMDEAVDALEERLRRQLERLSEERGPHRGSGEPEPGEWRHSYLPSRRPPYFPRPVEERQVVAHKSFALATMLPDEAVYEMEALDYDFFLFTDAETGEDALVHRREDGTYGLMQITPSGDERLARCAFPLVLDPAPAPELTLEQATARLDASGEPFVFYVDAETGRGNVVYRRYDGHYGRIVPADLPAAVP
jgi:ribosomal subunit interface protein